MLEKQTLESEAERSVDVLIETRPSAGTEGQDLFLIPPVILDGTRESARKAVSSYIRRHQNQGNVPAAEEEAKRLAPYFKSWGARLKEAFDKLKNGEDASQPRNSKIARWSRYRLLKGETSSLIEPGNLSRLFTKIAAHNRTTLLSTVMLVPTDSFYEEDGVLSPYIKNDKGKEFSQRAHYLNHEIDFGFLQIFSKSDSKDMKDIPDDLIPRSSVSIPVLGLDKHFLKAIEPCGGEALLRHFQAALTWANHDMLHHFTADLVNNQVADNAFQGQEPLREWDEKNAPAHGDEVPDGYEGWANTSQARTWRYLSNTEIGEGFKRHIDLFLEELEKISRALQEDKSVTDEKRHQIIDYFGTMMGFTIARIFPLDSPILTEFIDHLEKIDPTPDAVFEEEKRATDCRKIIEHHLLAEPFLQTSAEPVLKVIDALLENASIGDNKVVEARLKSVSIGDDFWGVFQDTLYFLRQDIKREPDGRPDKKDFFNLCKECLTGKIEETRGELYPEKFRRLLRYDINHAISKLQKNPSDEAEKLRRRIQDILVLDALQAAADSVIRSMRNLDDFPEGEKPDFYNLSHPERNYRTMKRLQIAKMIPQIAYIHVDKDQGPNLKRTQDKIDETDMAMINAVVEVTGFKP